MMRGVTIAIVSMLTLGLAGSGGGADSRAASSDQGQLPLGLHGELHGRAAGREGGLPVPPEEPRQPFRRLPAGDQGNQRRGKAGGSRSSRCTCRAGPSTGCDSGAYRCSSAGSASAAGISDDTRYSASSGAG